MPVTCQFGDIIFANFGKPGLHRPGYKHLALIVRDKDYERRGLVPVRILSSIPHKREEHFALDLPPRFPTQYVYLDRIYGLKPEQLERRIGSVDTERLTEILESRENTHIFMDADRYRPESLTED